MGARDDLTVLLEIFGNCFTEAWSIGEQREGRYYDFVNILALIPIFIGRESVDTNSQTHRHF